MSVDLTAAMTAKGAFGLVGRTYNRLNAALERHLPEQRLFLKSDTETRFVRLRPMTQALILGGGALVLAWTFVASAVMIMGAIGSGNAREQAARELAAYESRLNALSQERDARLAEAEAAQDRFAVALSQVSAMQSQLLASEERRRELETGIGVIQATLRSTMQDRDAARAEMQALTGGAVADAGAGVDGDELAETLDFVTAALTDTAAERDRMATEAAAAAEEVEAMIYDRRLAEERNDEIFAQLEEAVTVSMAPLDKMFTDAGLDPDDLISQVRRGYSGLGGPVMPLLPGDDRQGDASDAMLRARGILDGLDRMNMYRIAAQKAPFALPVKTAFRFTSGFGRRWGRLHAGVDLAGSHGSPIYSTADGVVVHAGWENGYGRMVEIQHDFGLRTRYGHLSAIKVSVGERVSRGDRIGDMGNTGNSTGTHLHYEVRVGGNPVNPMTFIKAANNVF
jgi:murein DD-endopeptidase MepM/ murein hydrolase activator NlpD